MKVERRLLGKNFFLVQRIQLAAAAMNQEKSTEEEETKQQQRMMMMKDLVKNIRSEGRMDAQSRWWVSELLAADCEKAWIHTGWEDAVQKRYEWLEEMRKKEKMEELHQHKVVQMIESAGRQCWVSA